MIKKPATEIVEKNKILIRYCKMWHYRWLLLRQRRGYTSMNGCVAAISVDTGKVLDIEGYVVLLSNM
ncbi:hypothetical protein TNCV_3206431 [Trichonephila clavipes]|nr:hypothetical protein TNCV_3206431 [Trichonephila clavipes]